MRTDQTKRLAELAEQLVDAFITEADPATWPGAGHESDMTQRERGDRYWSKKNASATGGVLRFALDLIGRTGADTPAAGGDEEDDLDKRIRQAERRASDALARAMKRASAPGDGRATRTG